jgi:hypothetical protein
MVEWGSVVGKREELGHGNKTASYFQIPLDYCERACGWNKKIELTMLT